jgi:hypothetical protein
MQRRRKDRLGLCGGGHWHCVPSRMDRIRNSWAREWEVRKGPSSLVEVLVADLLDRGWWH